MVSEEYSDTLQPGMATKCGPAMCAAIMERAKELGIPKGFAGHHNGQIVGVAMSYNRDGIVEYSGSGGHLKFIPTHEFLRLMENTKPPKKELTTEERLAEAVRLLDRVTTGHESLMKACGHYTTPEDFTHTGAARAFLKSIEP